VPAARQLSTRRQLLIRTLATGAAVAGGATLAACGPTRDTAAIISEPLPPPETTTLRIVNPVDCDPGLWLARDALLRDEGFTDVRYVDTQFTLRDWITHDLADMATAHPEFIVGSLDAGLPITMLTGLHNGCLEVWAKPSITSIGALRGKKISIRVANMSDHFYAFFATLLGWVGIDPVRGVQFVETGVESYPAMLAAFIDGRADAVLAGAAAGAYLRSLHMPANIIFDQAVQKPWSSYLCCTLIANRDWAKRNPVAAKRATRAILAATDAAASSRPLGFLAGSVITYGGGPGPHQFDLFGAGVDVQIVTTNPDGSAPGFCRLNGVTGLGHCTFSSGTGKLEGFSADLNVTNIGGGNWTLIGTYQRQSDDED
jgi:NitT/TauT family transport system substrate-binding protein